MAYDDLCTGEPRGDLVDVLDVDRGAAFVGGLERRIPDCGSELRQQTFVALLGRFPERGAKPLPDHVGGCQECNRALALPFGVLDARQDVEAVVSRVGDAGLTA